MDKKKESTPLSIIGKSDDFKAGFYIGQTERSAAIDKTLLGQRIMELLSSSSGSQVTIVRGDGTLS